MSSKSKAACNTVATKGRKNAVTTCRQSLTRQSESTSCSAPQCTPQKFATYENCSTLIEVTVKTKGHKQSTAMVSSSPRSQKMVEEKKKPTANTEGHQSWGQLLSEGILPVIKSGAQGLTTKSNTPKLTRQRSRSKESKTPKDVPDHQKHQIKSKTGEVLGRQSSGKKKIETCTKSIMHTGVPCTSPAKNMESVFVVDRAVQVDGIFCHPDNGFNGFNPVRTLGFLMKELEHLVTDEKAGKILSEMEQILLKIPSTSERKSCGKELESKMLRAKLETCTKELEKTSKEMNAMCECLREERTSLQRQVHKQASLLNDAKGRELHLENTIKELKLQLDEMEKAARSREKTVADLRNEIKGYEYSEKIIDELRANLNEQTELARQRHLDMQYLTLEKDKLSVLSAYKDTLLMELRKAVKDLQNHIAGQLTELKTTYMHEETVDPQTSFVHGGRACSSPTSTSSHESNIPTSWHDISDVSLSTVDRNLQDDVQSGKFVQKNKKLFHSTKQAYHDTEKESTRNGKDTRAKDSMHLDFISLPGGESSQTMLPSYKEIGTEPNPLVIKEEEGTSSINKKSPRTHHSDNTGTKTTSPGTSKNPKRSDAVESRVKRSSNVSKPTDSNKKHSYEGRSDISEANSNIVKSGLPSKLIGSTITEQFQNIFEGLRFQSRIPVEVPSPPRNYPNPDWNDSTLPSISAASELNVMQASNI